MEDPWKYRPVSLTSITGRLLKCILRKYICSHLEEARLITNTGMDLLIIHCVKQT